MLSFLFGGSPGQREKKLQLHTRRWQCNLQSLRRSYARLSSEQQKPQLTIHEIIGALKRLGIDDAKIDQLMNSKKGFFVEKLIMQTVAFFQHTITSSDVSRDLLLLPSEVVYHQANLQLPSSLQPLQSGGAASRFSKAKEDDDAELMPVSKACKLDKNQRPKDARDPRRNNRRLHLCVACGGYKLAVEFYACCVHDNPRWVADLAQYSRAAARRRPGSRSHSRVRGSGALESLDASNPLVFQVSSEQNATLLSAGAAVIACY